MAVLLTGGFTTSTMIPLQFVSDFLSVDVLDTVSVTYKLLLSLRIAFVFNFTSPLFFVVTVSCPT